MYRLLISSPALLRRRDFLSRMAAMSSSASPIDHSTDEAVSCWSCSQRVHRGGLTCQGCSKLQPLSSNLDLYTLMGMGPPMRYDIDLVKLEAQYKRLQWLVHPDLAASRSEAERAYGAASAIKLNEAFSVLKSPLMRARYLLHQRGVGAEIEEATVGDAAFLGEVMEAREAVEEAAEDVAVLESLLKDTQARASEVIRDLSLAFDLGQGGVEVAGELTMKLTYLMRIEEEIRGKIPTSYQ